jgi:hypothetical protein
VTGNQFAGLADAYPRAWACLAAVALAYGAGGGRWPYRAPAAPVPDLPAAEVEAPSASSREDAVVLSGIDTRFDQLLVGGVLPAGQGRGRARSLPGPHLAGLVRPHHLVHARPGLAGRQPGPGRKKGIGTSDPDMIGYMLPEIRRLLISLVQACAPDPEGVWR